MTLPINFVKIHCKEGIQNTKDSYRQVILTTKQLGLVLSATAMEKQFAQMAKRRMEMKGKKPIYTKLFEYSDLQRTDFCQSVWSSEGNLWI